MVSKQSFKPISNKKRNDILRYFVEIRKWLKLYGFHWNPKMEQVEIEIQAIPINWMPIPTKRCTQNNRQQKRNEGNTVWIINEFSFIFTLMNIHILKEFIYPMNFQMESTDVNLWCSFCINPLRINYAQLFALCFIVHRKKLLCILLLFNLSTVSFTYRFMLACLLACLARWLGKLQNNFYCLYQFVMKQILSTICRRPENSQF